MNKIILLLLLLGFTACSSISEKAGKLVPKINSAGIECPPASERTFKDILCKEAK